MHHSEVVDDNKRAHSMGEVNHVHDMDYVKVGVELEHFLVHYANVWDFLHMDYNCSW